MKAYYFYLLLLMFGLLTACNPGVTRVPQIKDNFQGRTIKNPNGSSCIVKLDTVDQLTGARITELMPDQLFTFTHDQLREFFKSKPLMVCQARLSKVGKSNYFLELQFTIQNARVNLNYQGLAKGSKLILKLINGESIPLYCYENQVVTSSQSEKVYRGLYPISIKDLKKLRKFILTDIGVHWNGGYENYEIHSIDFFKNQFDCLNQVR
jgi:hypothetical protein